MRRDQDEPGDVNLLLSPLTLAFAGANTFLCRCYLRSAHILPSSRLRQAKRAGTRVWIFALTFPASKEISPAENSSKKRQQCNEISLNFIFKEAYFTRRLKTSREKWWKTINMCCADYLYDNPAADEWLNPSGLVSHHKIQLAKKAQQYCPQFAQLTAAFSDKIRLPECPQTCMPLQRFKQSLWGFTTDKLG